MNLKKMFLKNSLLKKGPSDRPFHCGPQSRENLSLRFSRFIPTKNDQELICKELSPVSARFKTSVHISLSFVKESDLFRGHMALSREGKVIEYSDLALTLKELIVCFREFMNRCDEESFLQGVIPMAVPTITREDTFILS